MSKKVGIPTLNTPDAGLSTFATNVKSNLDRITGQEKNKKNLTTLPETATLDDVRNAVNIIIERLGSD